MSVHLTQPKVDKDGNPVLDDSGSQIVEELKCMVCNQSYCDCPYRKADGSWDWGLWYRNMAGA